MKTVTLQDSATLSFADHAKANELVAGLARLAKGSEYLYEEASGKKVRVKYVGTANLNAVFQLVDGKEYLAPITDMGDGSFFFEYLTAI